MSAVADLGKSLRSSVNKFRRTEKSSRVIVALKSLFPIGLSMARPALKRRYKTLRLIMGDQLNAAHSWYKEKDDSILYIVAELKSEASYAPHHAQKIAAFFAAMESFADALGNAGHHVEHFNLDITQKASRPLANFSDLALFLLDRYKISRFEYQQPEEHRLDEMMHGLVDELTSRDVICRCVTTEHFFLEIDELGDYFKTDKNNLLEHFYRKLRKKTRYLMTEEGPEGGDWNYDVKNRNKLKQSDLDDIPAPLSFSNNVEEINQRLERHKIKTIGVSQDSLIHPVNRAQARKLLQYFCKYLLPRFGTFQDSMTAHSAHRWALYHSRISFALNAKIISPKEVIDASIKAYRNSEGSIEISQIEGFVRQILGWREFVRGIYWTFMPRYKTLNALDAKRALPEFYWTADTKMRCVKEAVSQSLDYAYAHHIQRLMITGNFALLAGVHPDEVDSWYLGIYIDAIEWVELPNTRGMSQFADGGIVGSKPYASSGNYINKMSDYCGSCHYKVSKREEENACPFNSLYWHFMNRHRKKLERNPRIGMAYRTFDRMHEETRQAILERGQWCLDHVNEL